MIGCTFVKTVYSVSKIHHFLDSTRYKLFINSFIRIGTRARGCSRVVPSLMFVYFLGFFLVADFCMVIILTKLMIELISKNTEGKKERKKRWTDNVVTSAYIFIIPALASADQCFMWKPPTCYSASIIYEPTVSFLAWLGAAARATDYVQTRVAELSCPLATHRPFIMKIANESPRRV